MKMFQLARRLRQKIKWSALSFNTTERACERQGYKYITRKTRPLSFPTLHHCQNQVATVNEYDDLLGQEVDANRRTFW